MKFWPAVSPARGCALSGKGKVCRYAREVGGVIKGLDVLKGMALIVRTKVAILTG